MLMMIIMYIILMVKEKSKGVIYEKDILIYGYSGISYKLFLYF